MLWASSSSAVRILAVTPVYFSPRSSQLKRPEARWLKLARVMLSSPNLDDNDMDIISMINEGTSGNVIVLLNKSDLETRTTAEDIRRFIDCPVISISAREQSGLDELEKKIVDMFMGGNISYNDEVMITRVRQKDALNQAKESLLLVKDGINLQMPEDLLTIDLMNAYEELGKITGEAVEEDLVNEIFSKFCMGK